MSKKRVHEPRECVLCGSIFVPTHGCKKMCPECTDVVYHSRGRRLPKQYDNPTNIEAYEIKLRQRYMERYKDTIVAEGYAARQRANTLAMVGKIKVEL